MTNRIAVFLGMFLIAAIALDSYFYGSQHFVFLAKKFTDMIEWMAFWR